MKIYTRTGDQGTTGLIGGTRVPKHHLRIEAYGTVDELNSVLGMVRDQPELASSLPLLQAIQDRLFTIGSHLASDPETSRMKLPDLLEADVTALETAMDAMNEMLPELKNFILPGGHTAASWCHIARCVCRRSERLVSALAESEPVPGLVLIYLNRLSDFLFVLARKVLHDQSSTEIAWTPRNP